MKLKKQYGFNKEKATGGVWFTVGDPQDPAQVKLCLRNNTELQRLTLERLREHKLQSNSSYVPVEVSQRIALELFCEKIVKDWKNIQDEQGQDIPYSIEAAIKAFQDYPRFLEICEVLSDQIEQFQDNEEKKQEKNSGTPSSGI